MLINPNVQQISYTVQPAPQSNGIAQSDLLRSDLPPVEQSPQSAGGQNQQLGNDGRFRDSFGRQQALATSADSSAQPSATDDVSGQGSVSSATGRPSSGGKEQAAQDSEERIAEQKRREDAAIIQQLKARDREVRLHEAAHAAVGGRYAGAPKFQYERGPDGVNYAVSGEVSISVSPAATPEETIEKARQIRAAATAPAEPSAQDRAVAAEASRMEAEARSEIQAQALEERTERSERVQSSRDEDRDGDAAAAEGDSEVADVVTVSEVQIENSTPEIPSVNEAGGGENDQRQVAAADDGNERKDARQQLEEILLGNSSVPQSLNQAGLVDVQNPYGKSGLIEYIV